MGSCASEKISSEDRWIISENLLCVLGNIKAEELSTGSAHNLQIDKKAGESRNALRKHWLVEKGHLE